MPALMAFASMLAAASAFMVMLAVVVAVDVRIKLQLICEKGLYRRVRIPAGSAVELNARFRQCRLSAAADAAADQDIRLQGRENARKSTVAGSVGAYHLGGNNLSVLYIVNLKGFCVSKMLKNLSIFVSNCDSHLMISFRYLKYLIAGMFKAVLKAAETVAAIAELIVAAFNL